MAGLSPRFAYARLLVETSGKAVFLSEHSPSRAIFSPRIGILSPENIKAFKTSGENNK
jgi:hypothetical protein